MTDCKPIWRCLAVLVGMFLSCSTATMAQDAEKKADAASPPSAAWMRVTLGDGYSDPVYIRIFATPLYQYWALAQGGRVEEGRFPSDQVNANRLTSGQSTGWCDISPLLYPKNDDATLRIRPVFKISQEAGHFKGKIEFASAPRDDAIVKTYHVDQEPATINIVLPPRLGRDFGAPGYAQHIASDLEYATYYGRLADQHDWPTIGRHPTRFPFLVSASMAPAVTNRAVVERELKTLKYLGFNGMTQEEFHPESGFPFTSLSGRHNWMWDSKHKTYSAPNREDIVKLAREAYTRQKKAGLAIENIAYAMLRDEPSGEDLKVIAADEASNDGFRAWLKERNLTAADLLVDDWSQVRLVTPGQRDQYPALYYYAHTYRTIALGNFIALQRKAIREVWDADIPAVVNFPQGVVYEANIQNNVDFFTLCRETDQNAVWTEDWAVGTTYLLGSYQAAILEAAARGKQLKTGMLVVAAHGRLPFDVQLKYISEAARGIQMFDCFKYGPKWSSYASEYTVYNNTAMWTPIATAARQLGAVEDDLLVARRRPAKVALLYAVSSDTWSYKHNNSFGLDRMVTWLALTHAQIPVDILDEHDVAQGMLDDYEVCYYAGTNLTRATAQRLSQWVQSGGSLVMTAAAGQRDEYNRPLTTLDDLLDFKRLPTQIHKRLGIVDGAVERLNAVDQVTTSQGVTIDVLAAMQSFDQVSASERTRIVARFRDGTPAEVSSQVGKGRILCRGYLPGLAYDRVTWMARQDVENKMKAMDPAIPVQNWHLNGFLIGLDQTPLGMTTRKPSVISDAPPNSDTALRIKSMNPWQYPADIRQVITGPVLEANVELPIHCNVPLVDAVCMDYPDGVLIPLANYAIKPIEKLSLSVAIDKPVEQVESVNHGKLAFTQTKDGRIDIQLPLDCTDFITIRYAR